MTQRRRRRQREEITAIGRGGDLSRAIALVRDHLLEFPDDDDLASSVLEWVVASGDQRLAAEADDLVSPRSTKPAPAPAPAP